MNFKIFYISALLLLAATGVFAQSVELKGRIISTVDNKPVAQASVSSPGAMGSVVSDANGEFTLTLSTSNTTVSVLHEQFIKQTVFVGARNSVTIYMVPVNLPFYYDNLELPLSSVPTSQKISSSFTVNSRDMNIAYDTPEEALHGKIPGLNVLSKSGMPGEGAYIANRGIRTLYSSNQPLIVVDGVPYLSYTDESMILTGYSQSQFMPMHLKETENISFIRGVDAAMYGSLSSNGIVNITTEKTRNLETQIEFHTVEGITFMNKRMPVLNSAQYSNYMGDVGETAYSDLQQLVKLFPFLIQTDPPEDGVIPEPGENDVSWRYTYIYENDTKWQDEIFTPAITSENILKVKGGDAVANYAISVGYLYNKGIIENTDLNKIYSRMNADIKVTKNLTMFVNAGFTHFNTDIMEQGLSYATNPIFAALHKSPMFAPYERNADGENLGHYSQIAIGGNYAPTKDPAGVSNPSAIVGSVEGESDGFNVLVNVGLKYDLTPKWAVTSIFGVNYAYNREDIFIPGVTSMAIAPVSEDAYNTVRSGVNESNNLYFNINTTYNTVLNGMHGLKGTVGFQLLTSKTEYDMGSGMNTSSDFYKTLGSTSTFGRDIDGFTYAWNWLDFYANATYDFKKTLYVTAGVTADAASSIGVYNDTFAFFPSVAAGVNLMNTSWLRDTKALSQLTLRGEFAQLPNSRYMSSMSAYLYGSTPYRDQAGIVRESVPNTHLKAEVNNSLSAGLDIASYGRKIGATIDVFNETTKDMLNQRELTAPYGSGYIYDNTGEVNTYGLEVGLHALILNRGGFEWRAGGTFATYKSEIVSLGGVSDRVITFGDGSTLINRVGESPYSFYGYKTEGVFSKDEDNQGPGGAKLINYNGHVFAGGDIKFQDMGGSKFVIGTDTYSYINDNDRSILGSALPEFYGGFYSSFKYKGFGLMLQFTYSYGNEVYNAVRRSTESMNSFNNQSTTVLRRWTSPGQTTDVPRASYNDPAGNSRFSDRWIEDGSYLRLKYCTLNYTFEGGLDKFYRQIDIYFTAENLLTWTKYSGFDPEFSYNNDPMMQGMDLGKVPLAKTVRLGVKFNF